MNDARHMQRAIELARRAEGFTHPNPMVGCVLVKDGAVVAEGWHEAPGREHAEAMALRLAGQRARGATAYVTLEPCNHHGRTPPCAKALVEAGVGEVVYGMRDLNDLAEGGAGTLRAAGIPARLVEGRVRTECAALVRPWVHTLRCHRPWVTAKLAMSLDGFTATRSGQSKWITGAAARARGHDLRQRTGAIMVGVGTILADDPGLDPRPEGRSPAPSLKVVLDSALNTPPAARFLATPGPCLIVTTKTADERRAETLRARGAEILRLEARDGRPSLDEALRALKQRDVTDLMIEGGGTLLGAAFDAGVVDEVWAFMAPVLFGGGRPAILGEGTARIEDAFRLAGTVTEQLGPDLLVRGIRERRPAPCSRD